MRKHGRWLEGRGDHNARRRGGAFSSSPLLTSGQQVATWRTSVLSFPVQIARNIGQARETSDPPSRFRVDAAPTAGCIVEQDNSR
jgi:hypothetical protein